MSTKTVAQMEAVLLDRIEKAKDKLAKLQQKHQLEIGNLAYQHGLQKFSLAQLNQAFESITRDFS